MSEQEITQQLKEIANNVVNGDLSERATLFQSITGIVEGEGVTSTVIRTICKIIATTLTKYKDPFSQGLIKGLILSLLKHHPDATVEHFNAVFKALVLKELPNAPPLKGAQAALIALNWSVIIATNSKQEGGEFNKLKEFQLGLYQLAIGCGNEKLGERAYEIVKVLFTKVTNSREIYFEKLVQVEPGHPGITLFIMAYLKYAKEENEETDLLDKNKPKITDHFIKSLVTVKTKPNVYHITACRLLLNSLTKEEFKSSILPSLSRAMLRSPEIILQGVGAIVKELQLDISEFSMELGKTLIQNLYSKNDVARVEAVESLKCVGNKCSDVSAIQALVNQAFGVLNGSDGKITVAEYRINVLQGIGNLSQNNCSPADIPKILPSISEHFVKALESEIQEKVLCHALEMFGLWSVQFNDEIPPKIVTAFKKGLDSKSQQIRISYLQWFLSCLQHGRLPPGVTFTAELVKLVEKAAQNTTQIPVVSEGLSAACINLITKDVSTDQAKNSLNIVLDMNKQVFVNEKFLVAAHGITPYYVALMCERLLLEHFDELKGSSEPLFKALIFCANHTNGKVRELCVTLLNNLVQSKDGVKLANHLLNELTNYIQGAKIHIDSSSDEQSIPVTAFIESILVITNIPKIHPVDAQSIILSSLLCCHVAEVFQAQPKLWETITSRLEQDPKQVLLLNKTKVNEFVLEKYKASAMFENTVATVVKICPSVLLPSIVSQILDDFGKPEMTEVTDDEYFTFLTPDGELYDKSVLPDSDANVKTDHLKRENKAYSYKEQLEELQLRREIEAKKKAEGKWKPPQLTPKQKEAIKVQTDKENAIKTRLRALNVKIETAVSQLRGVSKGNGKQLSSHFATLLPSILRMFKSPLAAPALTKLYYDLHDTCFIDDWSALGSSIAIATIRQHNPKCDLKEEWNNLDLKEFISETLEDLYGETVELMTDEDNEKEQSECMLESPAFCYAFDFLKPSLTSKYLENSEDLLIKGIQLISLHAQTRADISDDPVEDYRHPKYLPRLEMMRVLLELIIKHRGRIQSQAVAAFLEVAESSSGKEGCATADKQEIDCLLQAVQNNLDVVRDVALRGLTAMVNVLPRIEDDYDFGLKLIRRVWVARFDINEENIDLADALWINAKFEVPIVLTDELLKDVIHPESCIQKAGASALVAVLKEDPSMVKSVLDQLLEIYNEKLTMIPAVLDQFDREIEPARDPWGPRRGVAIAICQVSQFFDLETVESVMQFMVSTGLRDREESVQKEMLNAALAVVDCHGKECVGHLLPVFEEFLDKAPNTSSYDNIRMSVVIIMGSLARHLDKDDEKIQPIVHKLLSALATPSQQVQEAVANCLPYLIPSMKDQANAIVKKLLNQLVKSEKYGERRGAAYGLAGLVKGLGILSLKQLDIMKKLTNFITDKKSYKSREGALFAFEMLCSTLGRLFEPYIVHVLPHLLQCFGDSSQFVRQAADDTAKVVMGKLSAHGVKLVLPSLLKALDEDSWRTKTASAELLGAMAYCAPKQLSSCLPSIVPKLMEVLSDSHIKVQEAGADALKVIGSVIKNPEIQAIVPVLLRALEDPSNKTQACLQSLLDLRFIHFVDAPSLALIMPVVERAFMDRSTETRKMAAQIIGNMYSLTDQKDLAPYLPNIIPGLKASLLDPVPEVRSVSARALGAMVKGMGESSFEDLLPWLMQTLTSESSSVDRSGAAQGLSEVVGGLGVEKLHKLMPEIIATAERTDIAPHVKDGYIMMFIYMPSAFPNDFTPYIGQIINPILKALADENEYVRDTALKAGQRIVNLYAESAITLLLPELERGLFDDNWRIRYSSVQLLGDLLYRISGVSGKMTTETASEDDNFGTEQSHKAIIRSLGTERRNRVLAGLYMGRSDVSLMVRQAALHVWKVVVTNTPRTLREILPTLFGLLLGCLASKSYDKRQVAARTLGDLVRKLGERVLPEIIPILERGLNSDQPDQRQGVCIGLSEIMASTSRDMVLTFTDSLVPTVRKALSDPLPEVRQAAAKTFDSLHSTVGSRALDDILPSMLNSLSDPDPIVAECTLDGLRQVMAIKSRVVLPYLVPQLTSKPVNTKALSILASVAGEALTKYLPKILPALLSALAGAQGTQDESQELDYCQAVILSVSDEVGVRIVVDTLLDAAKSSDLQTKKAASQLLCAFCTHSPGDYSQYVPQMLRGLLRLLADEDRDVLQRSWDALNSVTKTLDSAQQIAHVSDVRQAVKFAASDIKNGELPGFCLPKGITPLLPVFREAILNGLPEEKENAAQGLGEVIQLTSASSLQPSVVHITGPLIRILGDRFNAGVKAAVLETLAILLHKVGVMLKQFLPQLQTTFLKALHDPNRSVRMKAGYALAELVVIHPRPDPLFIEIHNGIKAVNTEDPTIKETMCQALRGLLTPSGDKLSEPLKRQIYQTLASMLGIPEDVARSAASGCFGALVRWLNADQLDDALTNHILNEDYGDDWTLRHGRSAALFVALKEAPTTVFTEKYQAKICKNIIGNITHERLQIANNAIRAGVYIFQYCLNEKQTLPVILISPFVKSMNHQSHEVKQILAKTCIYLAKVVPPSNMTPELLKALIPMLVNGTKEKNGYVKSNSEIALIEILGLRKGEETFQKTVSLLEVGARDSLNEVANKVLRKALMLPYIGKDEELDDTLLS